MLFFLFLNMYLSLELRLSGVASLEVGVTGGLEARQKPVNAAAAFRQFSLLNYAQRSDRRRAGGKQFHFE